MKLFRLIIILILSGINTILAQCTLDLGPNLYGCTGFQGYDTLELGINFSYSGSVGIAEYKWSARYEFTIGSTNYILHASDLLNDTTIENPKLIYDGADSVFFKLTIIDSLGNICYDSIQVVFSYFGTHLAYISPTILHGDSVFLNFTPNAFGGLGKVSYLWRPNHGLRDSTLPFGFWAKPDSSIAYYLTVTDSVGCTATAPPLYFVTVNHIGIDENELNNQVKVFPNPTKGIVNITSKDLHIEGMSICNVLGQQVYFSSLFQEQIDISSFPEGLYILILETNKGAVRKKIKKE